MNATTDVKAPYNTAIFYDVENLIKGYGFSKKIIQGLSLHDILKKIGETGKTGRIATHKAYANWLIPTLSFLHSELIDLDIEPITVVGTNGGAIKNVADIRLAVDVIDTLHNHPEITTYVIISGDGAYASLARKLHEYSKVVVGCAYKQSTNKLFASACDHFIWIEDPEVDNDKVEVRVSDTRSQHLIEKLNGKDTNDNNLIWSRINELLSTFVSSREYNKVLERGVNPSVVREFIGAAIPNFNPSALGFDRFIDFLAHAVENTEMAIYLIPPSEIKIGLKSAKPQNGVSLSKSNVKRFGQDDHYDIRDQRIKRMLREVKSISTNASSQEVAEKLKEIITWVANDTEFKASIDEGINPSTIDCAIREVIVGFTYSRLGFSRFSDLLAWLTADTELCITQNKSNKSVWRVMYRTSIPAEYSIYESKQVLQTSKEKEVQEPLTPWEQPKEPTTIFKQLSNLFKAKH
jgi:hypothetical protein